MAKQRKAQIRHRFFFKLVSICAGTVLVTIILLTFLLANRFQSSALADLKHNQRNIISQYAEQVDDLQQNAMMIQQIISYTPEAVDFLNGNTSDPSDRYILNLRLRTIINQNPSVHSLSLYYQNEIQKEDDSNLFHIYRGTAGGLVKENIGQYFEKLTMSDTGYFFPRVLQYDGIHNGSDNESLITMIIPYAYDDNTLDASGHPIVSAAIAINYSGQYFFSNSKPSTTGSLMILNDQQELLSHSLDLSAEKAQALSSELSSLKGDGGSIDVEANGKKYLATYIRDSHYELVSLISYDSMFIYTRGFLLQTIVLCIVIFLTALLLVYFLLRRTYRPIGYILSSISEQAEEFGATESSQNEIEFIKTQFDEMSKKIDEAAEEHNHSLPYIKRQVVYNLLYTNISRDYDKTVAEYFPRFAKYSRFQILIIHSNDGDKGIYSYTSMDDKQQALNMQRCISLHLIKRTYILYQDSDKNFVVICGLSDEEPAFTSEEVRELFHQLCGSNLLVTISVENPVESLEQLMPSFGRACELLKSKFMLGPCGIISQEDVDSLTTSTFVIQKNIDKILKCLKSCDEQALNQEIQLIFLSIKQCCYDLAMLIINTLIYHIMETANALLSEDNDMQNLNVSNLYMNLTHMTTIDETEDYLLTICHALIEKLKKKKDNYKYTLCAAIQEFVQENLCSRELSLEYIGEHFRLSGGYVGKVFKSVTNLNLTEYVNQSRIELAKKLLAESDENVGEIGEKIGFSNSAYFIATFKKYVGTSPNSYRKSLHLQE